MKNLIKQLSMLLPIISFSAYAEVPRVDPEWINPEDRIHSESLIPWGASAKLDKMVTGIFSSMRESIEAGPKKESDLISNPKMPNWTPWHLEVFTTELSVLNSGPLGLLTGKGSPTAIAYWRRQGAKPANFNKNKEFADSEVHSVPTANLDEVYDENSLQAELAPMINAAMATGKIKDEAAFRSNLTLAALDFYKLANAVNTNPGMNWWVSALRFDLIVAASGKLVPAPLPLSTVGGEVRIRFDWKRLMKKTPAKANFLSSDLDKAQESFVTLVSSISQDLEQAMTDKLEKKGLQPYTMRIGLGFSAGGNVGIAKSSAQAVAQIYFSRDQQAPKVYPRNNFVAKFVDSYPLIEDINESHLKYAKDHQIAFTVDSDSDQAKAIYQVNRKQFQNGLKKAFKMASFFAKAGQKAESNKWKLYQMKTGLDLSLAGTTGVVTLTGSTTAELAFYNMNF
ncbi:MAG: hypothetical protein ACXVLQ_14720 [Bacteriovorax sp.]